jgi:hypothetical protein
MWVLTLASAPDLPVRGLPCSPQTRTERRASRQPNRAQNRRSVRRAPQAHMCRYALPAPSLDAPFGFAFGARPETQIGSYVRRWFGIDGRFGQAISTLSP